MPNQYSGAYADIHQWNNLYRSYRNAARGKRGRQAAAAFEYRLEGNLIALRNDLADESYRPLGYSHFTIQPFSTGHFCERRKNPTIVMPECCYRASIFPEYLWIPAKNLRE